MGCDRTGTLYFPFLGTRQNMSVAGELKWMGQPDTRGKRMFQFL
jgi:hypothetical protein